MNDDGLKRRTAKGLLWGGIGNGTMQLLNLAFGIFLSRLLTPGDYGLIGALTIFSATAGIFAESGLTLAIVNKPRADSHDYNAAFWFNAAAGLALYLLLFMLAPAIARFYHEPVMVPVARLLFLGFLFGALGAAPAAWLMRELRVKTRSKIMIAAICTSGAAGVTCAWMGMGYWGLALQTVLYSGITALLMWAAVPWRPRWAWRRGRLRAMLPFSLRQLFTSLFTHFNNNLFALLLGRFYGMSPTGFYTQGNKWTTMGAATVTGMIGAVAQPVMRRAATDHARLRRMFLKMLRFTSFVSFPAMFGLALIAREVIVITITARWLPAVPVMHILCIWGAFMPLATLYSGMFNSINRPRIYMWCTIALGLVQIGVLLASYPFGLRTMLGVYAAINVLWLLVWQRFARRCIGLRLIDALRSVVPYMVTAAAVMALTWWATRLIDDPWLSLVAKVAMAAALYLLAMWALGSVMMRECLDYLLHRGSPDADADAGSSDSDQPDSDDSDHSDH